MISVNIGTALAAPAGTGAAPAPPAENLLLWTEAMNNAAWSATGGMVVSADQIAAPDGQTTADRCISPALGATIEQVSATASTSGSPVATSVTVSSAGWVREFVTGTFDSLDYCLSVYVRALSGAGNTLDLVLDRSGGFLRARLEDTTDGLTFYAWGWQLETGTAPTAYVPRTT